MKERNENLGSERKEEETDQESLVAKNEGNDELMKRVVDGFIQISQERET